MYFQSVRDVGLIYFSPRQWFYQIACKQLRSHLSTDKRPRGSLVSSSSFVSFSMSLLNLQVLKPVEIEATIYQSYSLQLLQQKVLGYIEAEGLNSESSCIRPVIRDPNHVSLRQAYMYSSSYLPNSHLLCLIFTNLTFTTDQIYHEKKDKLSWN